MEEFRFILTGPSYVIERTFNNPGRYKGCFTVYANIDKHHEEEFIKNKNIISRNYIDNILKNPISHYEIDKSYTGFYTYKIEEIKIREINYDDCSYSML